MTSAPNDEQVILVDDDDREIGVAPKLRVHETGELHRAVSVFLFDREGRVLLQRRAPDKYHCGGLWSNTCCGHPRPGESVADAAQRRLREEMGIDCALTPRGTFRYKAPVDANLVEHEIDHLFIGRFDGTPRPDPSEVSEWRWTFTAEVITDSAKSPWLYTPWLPLALEALQPHGDGTAH